MPGLVATGTPGRAAPGAALGGKAGVAPAAAGGIADSTGTLAAGVVGEAVATPGTDVPTGDGDLGGAAADGVAGDAPNLMPVGSGIGGSMTPGCAITTSSGRTLCIPGRPRDRSEGTGSPCRRLGVVDLIRFDILRPGSIDDPRGFNRPGVRRGGGLGPRGRAGTVAGRQALLQHHHPGWRVRSSWPDHPVADTSPVEQPRQQGVHGNRRVGPADGRLGRDLVQPADLEAGQFGEACQDLTEDGAVGVEVRVPGRALHPHRQRPLRGLLARGHGGRPAKAGEDRQPGEHRRPSDLVHRSLRWPRLHHSPFPCHRPSW